MIDIQWVESFEDINNRPKSDICLSCGKPIKENFGNGLCNKCNKAFISNGLIGYYIPLVKVGELTTDIQQSLHTRFFGCNAPLKYRGEAYNRLYIPKNQLLQTLIESRVKMLDKYLSSDYLPSSVPQLKPIDVRTNKHLNLYKEIRIIGNVTKRLLYNITLYFYLHYISHRTRFVNDNHFKASVVNHILSYIQNTYIRTKIGKGKREEINKFLFDIKRAKVSYPNRFYFALFSVLPDIVSPIISKLYYLKPLYRYKKPSSTKFGSKKPMKQKPLIKIKD